MQRGGLAHAAARRAGARREAVESAPSKRLAPEGGADEEAAALREQVALLAMSLEREKQRRAVEQNLMQSKIIELQGLIRRNLPEQQLALERRLQAAKASPPAAKARAARAAKARALAKLGGGQSGGGGTVCLHVAHRPLHPLHYEQALPGRSLSAPPALGAGARETAAPRVAVLAAERERRLRLEREAALAAADERLRRAALQLAAAGRHAAQLADDKQQLAALVSAQAACIRRLERAAAQAAGDRAAVACARPG